MELENWIYLCGPTCCCDKYFFLMICKYVSSRFFSLQTISYKNLLVISFTTLFQAQFISKLTWNELKNMILLYDFIFVSKICKKLFFCGGEVWVNLKNPNKQERCISRDFHYGEFAFYFRKRQSTLNKSKMFYFEQRAICERITFLTYKETSRIRKFWFRRNFQYM